MNEWEFDGVLGLGLELGLACSTRVVWNIHEGNAQCRGWEHDGRNDQKQCKGSFSFVPMCLRRILGYIRFLDMLNSQLHTEEVHQPF